MDKCVNGHLRPCSLEDVPGPLAAAAWTSTAALLGEGFPPTLCVGAERPGRTGLTADTESRLKENLQLPGTVVREFLPRAPADPCLLRREAEADLQSSGLWLF